MTYEEVLDFIHGANKFGSKLGLVNITNLLEKMGNPQKRLKIIHLAGTNGKGSTASFINQILLEEGYCVGLFTSPFLETFNERIRVNNKLITNIELANALEKLIKSINLMISEGMQHPTEFEIVTALAFQYFLEKKVDYVVLEVGLGGRFDATNVIDKSLASVITSISLDHMHILGDTLDEIAFEKAGIIKENGRVFSYPQKQEVYKKLSEISELRNASLNTYDKDQIRNIKRTFSGSKFDWIDMQKTNNSLKNLEIKLIGEHQIFNASLAIMVLQKLSDEKIVKLSNKSIVDGLIKTRWNGRLEILKEDPIIMIDGAHNEDGAAALAKTLREYYPNYKKLLCLGILGDKNVKAILKHVIPEVDEVIVTSPPNPRAMKSEVLADLVKSYEVEMSVENDLNVAINKAIDMGNEFDIIVFSGSLYLIGEVRTKLLDKN